MQLIKSLDNCIVETNYINDGKQIIFRFDNSYGASVVNHKYSYGNELAVITFDNNNEWELCYDTYITSDVLGFLTNNEIIDTLIKIKNL